MIEATYIDHMGSDLSTVNAARVSFGKQSDWQQESKGEPPQLSAKDDKLVGYLANHGHFSPFGHATATFHVRAPIFVARQLVKHKFLRWNEISRRYVDDEPEFYKPDVWRGRSADKKQGSEGAVKLYGVAEQIVDDYAVEALTAYQVLLEAGVAPEQARMVLPQSTMTEWYWTGSLDAFANMCNLRCKPDTQQETRLVANQICVKMRELFPVSWLALRGLQ
jgi:thymidylate synthase (FAD)